MDSPRQGYQTFSERRQRLLSALRQVISCTERAKMDSFAPTLGTVLEKINTQAFKVLIVGEFNSGKSTFINALMGERILPSFALPCTAVITEVQYGEEKRAILYHRDPPGKAEQIDVETIQEHIVIQDAKIDGVESPYERLELYWPLDICRNRVVLIDSPGLNEAKVRSEVTLGYLPTTDAVLFIGNSEQPLAASQLDSLRIMRLQGFTQVFVIMNRFDQIEEFERSQLKDFVFRKLEGLTDIGRNGIHFVSAREALQGKLKGSKSQIESSGFPRLEQELERYLVEDKGRIKLMQPATQLRHLIPKILEEADRTRSALQQKTETLDAMYARTMKSLEIIRLQGESIRTRTQQFRSDIREVTQNRTREFYRSLASKIEPWSMEYTIKESFQLKGGDLLHPREAGERILKEIGDHLEMKLAEEAEQWQREALSPVIQSRFEDFCVELDGRAEKLIRDLDEVKGLITGKVAGPGGRTDGARRMSALDALTENGGPLLGHQNSGSGVNVGHVSLITSVGFAVGAVVAMGLVALNPQLWVVAVYGGAHGLGFVQSKIDENTKRQVANEYANWIRSNLESLVEAAGNEVDKASEALALRLSEGIAAEIRSAEFPFEHAKKLRSEGQSGVAASLQVLDEIRPILSGIEAGLDHLIAEISQESVG